MKATMSGLGRVEHCPPSSFLPGIQESSSDADRGRAIHDYLKNVATVGVKKALELAPEKYRDECACIDLEQLPHSNPDAWAVEVGLAWDWEADTGRELFRGDSRRDYSSAGPTEVCGTDDILGVTSDAVVVLDLKTGWGRLAPPGEAPQLLGYAVAAARAYGRDRAIVGWIKLRDEQPYFEMATLDMLELDAAAARLRAIIESAQATELLYEADPSSLALTVGPHCRYCPAFRQCPANVGLLRDLVYRDQVGEVPVLNEETAPLVLLRAEAAQKVLDRVFEALQQYADVSPFPLPDGEWFGRVESTKETIDALAAKCVLGDEIWDEAVKVEHKLTKADLKRSLKARLEPGEKITHVERAAHKALREAGAIKENRYWSVKRFKPEAGGSRLGEPQPQDTPEPEPQGSAPAPQHEPAPPPPDTKPAEVVRFPKPSKEGTPLVELGFGPHRGKPIGELSTEDLGDSISIAKEKLDTEPGAPWAASLKRQLEHLQYEQRSRAEEIGGAA